MGKECNRGVGLGKKSRRADVEKEYGLKEAGKKRRKERKKNNGFNG